MFVRPQIMFNAEGGASDPAPAADPAPVADNTPAADPAPAADPVADPAPAADPAATDPAADPAPAPKKNWQTTRIDQLTREKNDARRELERLRAELAAKPAADGTQAAPKTPGQEEIERRAAQLLEQRTFETKVKAWDRAGKAEFKDFDERCNVIAGMGLAPNEKPEFMATIVDMEDGHKIIAHLADDPDAAMELAAMPAHRMALKLAQLSAKIAPQPKQISRAPAPVSTPAGTTNPTPSLYDPNLSQDQYAKMRREQRESRRKWR